MLAQHPAFGKIIDNYLESKGIRVDALREASNDNTFSAAIQLATYGDASAGIDPMESLRDTKVQEEMMKETSQVLKNLIQHPEPQVRAVGLQMAATNAELRLSRSTASTPAPVVTAPDPIEEATKKARAAAQAKPVAKATVLKSAAAEGDRRSSPTQKSSLDERIAASAQKHLENITSARGRL